MSDVLVLCYHAVSRDWPSSLAVTPERLADHVRGLQRRGYAPTTFARAVADPPRRRTFAITFDDAFASVLEHALPVLERLGAPATVFAPTGFCDGARPLSWDGIEEWAGGPHAHELRALDWDELAFLAARDWEIGSHTVTHPHLTRLGEADLRHELEASRATCEERLGRACPSIAYPYGDVDPHVVGAAIAAGYRHGAALPHVPEHWEGPLTVARVGVYRKDSLPRFALKVSRPGRHLQAVRE